MPVTRLQVEADIRSASNHDADTMSTQAQYVYWINQAYNYVCRALAQKVPGLYTAVTASFTVSSGNTQDVTAAPLSLTTFSKIQRVEYYDGRFWRPLAVAPARDPESTARLAFRERGKVIEFYPSDALSGVQFRLRYVYLPPKMTADSDVLDLPDGVEEVIVEKVLARQRNREFMSDSEMARAGEVALANHILYLRDRYGQHSEPGYEEETDW